MLPATDNLKEYRGDTIRVRRYLGPPFTVTTVAGDATLTGQGVFTEDLEGEVVAGAGIPDGTTILTYTSPTSVEMSAVATAAATDITVAIGRYDLTGCTPTAQIREEDNADDVLYTFDCELTNQVTDPGGVVMEVEAGTTGDAPDAARFDWQLEFADGSVRTCGAGSVKFKGQVTMPVTA